MHNIKGRPVSIFLADDNQGDCISFGKVLSEIDLHTRLTFVKNGEQLLQLLGLDPALPPDIIFLDINMPVMNGYECLDEIRRNPQFENVPVVMMSVANDVATVNRAYKHKANLYICKPNSFSKLKSMLQQILAMEWDISPRQVIKSDFYMAL